MILLGLVECSRRGLAEESECFWGHMCPWSLVSPVSHLMDYIDGDRYYKTAYDEHNLVRARAQYALLCDMERRYDDMCATIDRIARRYRER